MSQQDQAGAPGQPSRGGRNAFLIIGLIIIAIISLAFAGYTTLNPQTTTLTQQQLLTNTQSIYNTQTVTTVSTVTSAAASMPTTSVASTVSIANIVSSTATASIIFVTPGGYSGCGTSGCYSPGLGAYGSMCQTTNQNGTAQCSGYLYEPSNGGCVKLAIPYINPDVLETTAYIYYTLQNLPPSHPPIGSWVTVTGQVYQVSTFSTPGETCAGSYIQVTSIS